MGLLIYTYEWTEGHSSELKAFLDHTLKVNGYLNCGVILILYYFVFVSCQHWNYFQVGCLIIFYVVP